MPKRGDKSDDSDAPKVGRAEFPDSARQEFVLLLHSVAAAQNPPHQWTTRRATCKVRMDESARKVGVRDFCVVPPELQIWRLRDGCVMFGGYEALRTEVLAKHPTIFPALSKRTTTKARRHSHHTEPRPSVARARAGALLTASPRVPRRTSFVSGRRASSRRR